MANSEKNRSRSGVGWLSRLILLSVVIGFGYLYLQSIEHEGGEGAGSLLDSIARLSPIPISALPVADQLKPAPVAPAETAAKTVETPARPASEVESRAFASSLAPSLPQPAPVRGASSTPAPAPAPVAPVPAAQVPVSAAPAASAAPSVSSQPASASPPLVRSPADPDPLDWQTAMAEQQARAMAQYEAERRAMEERARQYWEQARAATPVPPPYGSPAFPPPYYPPAYPPIYPPIYPPAAYAPPR